MWLSSSVARFWICLTMTKKQGKPYLRRKEIQFFPTFPCSWAHQDWLQLQNEGSRRTGGTFWWPTCLLRHSVDVLRWQRQKKNWLYNSTPESDEGTFSNMLFGKSYNGAGRNLSAGASTACTHSEWWETSSFLSCFIIWHRDRSCFYCVPECQG